MPKRKTEIKIPKKRKKNLPIIVTLKVIILFSTDDLEAPLPL